MARAPALQAGGRGFEPHILHESGQRQRCESPRGSLTGWKESRHKSKTSESKQLAVAREGGGTTIELEREASKGVRRMPWLPEAKKDAAGRESLRGGANGR